MNHKKLAPFLLLVAFLVPVAASAQVVPVGSVDEGGICYASDGDSGNADCMGNLACINGRCAVDSTLDSPGFGQQNGSVVPGGACAYNTDCQDQGSVQYECINSECEPDDGTVSSGGACENYGNGDSNCAGSLACISGICQVDTQLQAPANAPGSPYTDGACFTSSDCNAAAGYTCNTSTDTCVQGSGLTGATGGGITNITSTGAGGINTSYLSGYEQSILSIINTILVPLLTAVAFIVFLYGVFQTFILGGASEEKHKEGRVLILYGIIGFVVIFAVWGLVNILIGTLGLSAGGTHPIYPTL